MVTFSNQSWARVSSRENRLPTAEDVQEAESEIPRSLINRAIVQYSDRLSDEFNAKIYLILENKQKVRSYKIRGAYNALRKGNRRAVCASAGNHSQGFAASCNYLNLRGDVFMPVGASKQKMAATKRFGNGRVRVHSHGEVFDEAYAAARQYALDHQAFFVPPFDHPDVIAGQGTVALETLEQMSVAPHYYFAGVGGGGLASGSTLWLQENSPRTKTIGVEPDTSDAMNLSIDRGRRTKLRSMDTFIDGTAVLQPGKMNWHIIRDAVRNNSMQLMRVRENQVCQPMLDAYAIDDMVIEPAGALGIAALSTMRKQIRGKTVAVVVSGGNFDAELWPNIKIRAELDSGRRKNLTIALPRVPDALNHLTAAFKGKRININFIHHDDQDTEGRELAPVEMDLTTDRPEVLQQLIADLREKRYRIKEHNVPRKRTA